MRLKTGNLLLLRRLLFAAMIVVTAVFECTRGFIPQIKGVSAFVLIPLVVSIACFEKSVPSLFFGVFAGIMWDMYSITADGFFSVVMAAAAFFTAIIILFYMRSNIFTALILTFASALLCNTLYWLNFVLFADYTAPFYIYVRYYLPSAAYTTAYTFIFFFAVKWIYDKTSPERKRINY